MINFDLFCYEILNDNNLLRFFKETPSWVFMPEMVLNKLEISQKNKSNYPDKKISDDFVDFSISITKNVIYIYDNKIKTGYHLYTINYFDPNSTYCLFLYRDRQLQTISYNFDKSDVDKIKYIIANPEMINFI